MGVPGGGSKEPVDDVLKLGCCGVVNIVCVLDAIIYNII
jgi:hypothetical protein